MALLSRQCQWAEGSGLYRQGQGQCQAHSSSAVRAEVCPRIVVPCYCPAASWSRSAAQLLLVALVVQQINPFAFSVYFRCQVENNN